MKKIIFAVMLGILIFSYSVLFTQAQRVRIVPLTLWALIGNNIYNTNSGNVGIGTQNPEQKLEVNGGIRLNTNTTKPICSERARGTLWFERSNTGDILELCKLLEPNELNEPNVTIKTATLPTARSSLSCAENSATNKIYCFGGYINGSYINQIIEYNPSLDTIMTNEETLPTGRSSLSCTENSATNKIYCFGGIGEYRFTQILEYDPNSDTIAIKAATLPSGRFRLSCAENSETYNSIYCFGGLGGDYLNQIVEYGVRVLEWVRISP